MCADAIEISKIWELLAKINKGEKITRKEYDYIIRGGYPIKLVRPNIEEYVSH
jgi:hypothetical protein